MPEEILRTFIAIELDEPLRVALQRIQDKLKRQVPAGSVRWVAPEGIHLTLKFLGDTPRGRVGAIETALQAACTGIEPFEVSVEGRGCFPNFRRPRVIWVAVRDTGLEPPEHGGGVLKRLQSSVERRVAPLGWPTEERAFSPHLTIGRVSKGADASQVAAVGQGIERTVVEQIGSQRVIAVSLMQSDLRPTGAMYSRLLRIGLGEAEEAGSLSAGEGG